MQHSGVVKLLFFRFAVFWIGALWAPLRWKQSTLQTRPQFTATRRQFTAEDLNLRQLDLNSRPTISQPRKPWLKKDNAAEGSDYRLLFTWTPAGHAAGTESSYAHEHNTTQTHTTRSLSCIACLSISHRISIFRIYIVRVWPPSRPPTWRRPRRAPLMWRRHKAV